MTLRIAWLGPMMEESDAAGLVAFSHAASDWQARLAAALQELGASITVFSHVPQAIWPRDPLLSRARGRSIPRGLRGEFAGYWNLPSVRITSRARSYKRLLCAHSERQPFDYIFTYNADGAQLDAARDARSRYGSRWICIHADGPPVKGADGYIVLSWQCFEAERVRSRAIHIDGGVSCQEAAAKPRETSPGEPRRIVYAGSWTKYTGVFALVEAFSLLRDTSLRLHLCGKGDHVALERAISGDDRIILHGLLERDRLDEVMASATVFVNPRPVSGYLIQFTYPSKLLQYIGYCRPIVSTPCHGLAPEYDELIEFSAGEGASQLAEAIDQTLCWDPRRYMSRCRELAEFAQSRTWSIQANRIIRWIASVSGRGW
jgi:glycosyltransferase involved in cell wall biosynthesis